MSEKSLKILYFLGKRCSNHPPIYYFESDERNGENKFNKFWIKWSDLFRKGDAMAEREKQILLLNIAELLHERGLIDETEKNRMKNIINGNES